MGFGSNFSGAGRSKGIRVHRRERKRAPDRSREPPLAGVTGKTADTSWLPPLGSLPHWPLGRRLLQPASFSFSKTWSPVCVCKRTDIHRLFIVRGMQWCAVVVKTSRFKFVAFVIRIHYVALPSSQQQTHSAGVGVLRESLDRSSGQKRATFLSIPLFASRSTRSKLCALLGSG